MRMYAALNGDSIVSAPGEDAHLPALFRRLRRERHHAVAEQHQRRVPLDGFRDEASPLAQP